MQTIAAVSTQQNEDLDLHAFGYRSDICSSVYLEQYTYQHKVYKRKKSTKKSASQEYILLHNCVTYFC